MGNLHPRPQPPFQFVDCTVMGLGPVVASLTRRAAYMAASCFPIRDYRTSVPFHNWDQKPIVTFRELCFCHKPHPNPASSTYTISRNGRAGSTTRRVWACATARFVALKASSVLGVQSHWAPCHTRCCRGCIKKAKWGMNTLQNPAVPNRFVAASQSQVGDRPVFCQSLLPAVLLSY